MAIRHIKNSSDNYNIDPKKIAIGGFSAGAVNSINVAYGMKEEVAAVFANSGFPVVFKMGKLMTQSSNNPPILIFMAENDLPTVSSLLPPFVQFLDTLNVDYTFNWIPGYGHFYPSGATSLSDKGDKMSIEQRTIKFLKKNLQ